MNIFAHFKDIDSQCTQETIRNKLFLSIINQFHCYYYRVDHYRLCNDNHHTLYLTS